MKKFFILLQHEWRLLSLSRIGLISVFFFSFLVVFLLSLVLKKSTSASHEVAYQSMVISLFLAALFRFQRSFEEEARSMLVASLVMAGVSPLQLIAAKTLVNFFILILLILFSFLVGVVFFNSQQPLALFRYSIPVLVTSAVGISIMGTMMAAITSMHDKRELLLTLLLYPLVMPFVIALVNSPQYDYTGMMTGIEILWVKVMIGFSVIFLMLLWMLVDFLMEGMSA